MSSENLFKIDIQKADKSKISEVDFNTLAFGDVFTDHMFECDYKNGAWEVPKIVPYHNLSIPPSAKVFHYGQACFEGMKAYRDAQDQIWLFRPDENQRRINKSLERLAMPEFPADYFMEGLTALVNLEKEWVKSGEGNSLYLRPFAIATEPGVSAGPANEYKFMIICSPAKAYFSGEVRVRIADKYSRSANGGTGYAKAAGNYAGQFYPQELAHKEGLQQVIWTDASTHQNIEEAGAMNVFFRINDTLYTAPTSDRILDGVTRKSLIDLAKSLGHKVDVRYVTVNELIACAKDGSLKEIFGAGTAAVISPVLGFSYKDEAYEVPLPDNSYALKLKKHLTDIQTNKSEDPFGWRVLVE
ncbi:MAG: branched-chain amino acid aminotransferase [Flavobacteriales bacterium]|nr:branched-chain amino acid aminotransferase [Flavobacteriales bacterium]